MAKQSGLGDNLYIDGYDVSGDIGAVNRIAGGLVGTQDVTGINKFAMERIGLARDGGIDYTSFFNPATDQAHDVLSTLPTTDRIVTYCRGTTLGKPAACVTSKQLNYDGNRADDGAYTLQTQTQANGFGLQWGNQLTAGKRTDTGATNGTGVDFTASYAFGLVAWVHVFSFTGTDATIKLQESSDNGGADPFADVTGGAFTQVTAARTKERIATSASQTIERYLRVVTTTTGGFSEMTFAVVVAVNQTATVF